MAQEPAQPDPDSPAGVEYQLPLDQARRDAASDAGGGGGGSGPGGGSGVIPAPLFGAGITPDGSQGGEGGGRGAEATADDATRGGGEDSRSRGDRGAAGSGRGEAADPGAGQSTPSFSTAAAEDGGASTGLTLGGIALAVVVVGGALGLVLRRGLGTTAS